MNPNKTVVHICELKNLSLFVQMRFVSKFDYAKIDMLKETTYSVTTLDGMMPSSEV
jgi:hypothetical protein